MNQEESSPFGISAEEMLASCQREMARITALVRPVIDAWNRGETHEEGPFWGAVETLAYEFDPSDRIVQ